MSSPEDLFQEASHHEVVKDPMCGMSVVRQSASYQ